MYGVVQGFITLLKQLGPEALGPEVGQLLSNAAALVLKGEAPSQVRACARACVRACVFACC